MGADRLSLAQLLCNFLYHLLAYLLSFQTKPITALV